MLKVLHNHVQIRNYTILTLKIYRTSNFILSKYVPRATPAVGYVNHTKSNAAVTSTEVSTSVAKSVLEQPSPWMPTPSVEGKSLVQQYMKLSKIRLTTLVVVTSMAGYAMAPGAFEINTFAACLMGTALMSGAANAVNQFHEVPFDAQMARTKQRVLVCGRITPLHAVMFAVASSTLGIGILHFGANGLTASLGLANLILYTSVYTPLKRISILNTWVGSIVGAIPPLMGWAACAGSLNMGAWLMAALLYSWQFPHFNALSWNLRSDYSRAGYRMMSVTDPALCKRVALRHTVAINAMCFCAPLIETTNWWFAVEVLPFNLYFTYLAYKFYHDSSGSSSRKLFRFSLIHLPAVMLLFLLNKKKWYFLEGKTDDDNSDKDSNSSIV